MLKMNEYVEYKFKHSLIFTFVSGLLTLGSEWTAGDAGTEGMMCILTIKINLIHVTQCWVKKYSNGLPFIFR